MSDIMTVQGLDLWYGDHQALHDISMNIPEKSITGRPAAASPRFSKRSTA